MTNNILKRYYSPFKKKDETLTQTIQRVDSEIIDQRFKHLCNRDIFTLEDVNGNSRLD